MLTKRQVVGQRKDRKCTKPLYSKRKLLRPMTICIVAICESNTNPKIVFCADRLVTDANGLTYEQGQPKIIGLSENCLVMMAGKGAESDQIIKATLEKIREKYVDEPCPDIKGIVSILKKEHQQLREDCVSDEILKPRGLTLKEFYANIKNFPDWLGIMLDTQISNYDFGVNFLVFGFDIKENKYVFPRIYMLNEQGEEKLVNSVGFGIIGIGDSMSLPEITKETFNPKFPLSEALVRVYWAKKSAERVVSVGRETTDLGMMEVAKDGNGLIFINTITFDKNVMESLLQKNYAEYQKQIKNTTAQIQQNIDTLINPKTTKTINTPSQEHEVK